MVKRDIVVMGASAGGVEALSVVVRGLASDTCASVFVALHISDRSVLPEILQRHCALPVSHATNGETIRPGHVYVAPPGEHMVLEDGAILLSRSARENGHRPAIDPLFRSAARAHRQRVVGVILSGHLDDGAAGLFAVKSRGGLAVVQDPKTAAATSMPRAALHYVDVDYCLPPDAIGPLVSKLARGVRVRGRRKPATRAPRRGRNGNSTRPAQVPFNCPECQGPLYQVENGKLAQWSCEVGHRFSPESLDEVQRDALERALWIAARALRERALAEPFLARTLPAGDARELRERRLERAESAERDLEVIREILDRL